MSENHKPDGTMTKEALDAAKAELEGLGETGELKHTPEPFMSNPDEVPEMPAIPETPAEDLKKELEAAIAGAEPGKFLTENAPGAKALPPFEVAYKTIVNPTGAPDTWVAIMVGADGSIKIGVSSHGEDDAVDDALLP